MSRNGGSDPDRLSAFAVCITPFSADGAVDEGALRDHLRRLADAGIGLYLGGSGSGEGYTLSRTENIKILDIARDEVGGLVPIRSMGQEPRTAEQMIASLADAASTGSVEAAQIYSLDVGHGHRPKADAIERYLTSVLDASTLPCVISSHQSVGYRIHTDLYLRLLDTYPHLIGVNCSHADQLYLRELIEASRGRATVHVGGEAASMTALAFGANGFLSSAANMAPRLAVSVIDRFRANDLEGWVESYSTLHALGGLLYSHGGILATKAVLSTFGLPGGWPRLPHLPLPDAEVELVAQQVRALGVPEFEGWERS